MPLAFGRHAKVIFSVFHGFNVEQASLASPLQDSITDVCNIIFKSWLLHSHVSAQLPLCRCVSDQ